MKVDTNEIEWLLENVSQVEISAETGISQPTLSKIKRGERPIKNLRIVTGYQLTECAKKIKKMSKSS